MEQNRGAEISSSKGAKESVGKGCVTDDPGSSTSPGTKPRRHGPSAV